MLRKFLIPTVVVSIFLLLTTLTFITTTEATSVTTSATTTITTDRKATSTSQTTATAQQQYAKTSAVNKFLNNAKETTTSLLPLQPPLNVTSTTLASFILNQKHQQQQQHQKQKQHRLVQVLEETQQFQEHLLNDNVNEKRETKKKNLDYAFATVTSPIDIITPEPTSTHAYIPFDLDYNDPTEEKAKPEMARQSTINEVLTNLFPKGFSDIFRFSYANEGDTTSTPVMIPLIRSTPTPFKPMPTTKSNPETKLKSKETSSDTNSHEEHNPKNLTLITMTTSVTKETRREISPGHTEIVVEKIISEPNTYNATDDFKDGSNSISKDELLRINRAAREASVLPSLLVNPQYNSSSTEAVNKSIAPIVILNENDNDDFVDAPEDDNQIAESQNVVHQLYQKVPPPESTNFQATQNHQYNVRIIHDDTLRKAQDEDLERAQFSKQQPQRQSPSYQSFVEQSKYLQNSLQEAPSRKFLKNFPQTTLSQDSNANPVPKGNFHYEHNEPKSYIQTVPPAAQLQYVQYHQPQQQEQLREQPEQYQHLHTQNSDSQHVSDKDVYQTVESQNKEPQSRTPVNLVFVTISTPSPPTHETPKQSQTLLHDSMTAPSIPFKSPHEFVSDALGYQQLIEQLNDHETQETVDQPKSSNGGYTFVEVQKSINIHNKLITEKDGHLIEQHETIYPEHQYRDRLEPQTHLTEEQQHTQNNYVSLSENPIHVQQLDDKTNSEEYELAASLKEEQHAINPSQDLTEIGPIQQSNLVQESHIIETPNNEENGGTYDQQPQNHDEHFHTDDLQTYAQHQVDNQQIDHGSNPHPANNYHHEEHSVVEQYYPQDHHNFRIPSRDPYQPPIQIPYALPLNEKQHYQHQPQPQQQQPHHQSPLVYHDIIEKHIPVPYAVPEPVGVPVHIQHFIDRPYPVETIVEKPVPYPVETVVEKVVEKHVPVEVEKIVEKPVEKIVNKYIDRPIAIPIKIPVALHIPSSYGHSSYGSTSPHFPLTHGAADNAKPFAHGGGGGGSTYARIPTKVLQSYYTKMLKKLVPQMQQAYKNSPLASKPKTVPKITPKPFKKLNSKISDILFDLKPPPARPSGSNWDLGARYQYDYNTLPLDMAASSSMDAGQQVDRPGQGYKTNFDEFQRWRNGHTLKRSPDFGRNLHMEYGFKPPLVPSVEIDEKGMPLKAVADLTEGKEA